MIEIKQQNGKLVAAVFNNNGELESVKNTKDRFTSAGGSTTFSRDAQGKVMKIKIDAIGMTFECIKQ